MGFEFSLKILSETSVILRRIMRDYYYYYYYYYYYRYSALGPVWAETKLSQATGMALVR